MSEQRNDSLLLQKFRDECLKRGAGKIKGIGLLFRELDYECRGYLTFDQFYPGILERCVDFTPDEVKLLFVEFDRDNSGTIDYNEFLYSLRPPLNNNRINLIKKAFDQLDYFKQGKITIEDLRRVYSCKKNPKYLNGEWTEDECLIHFLNNFEIGQHKDGVVTIDEFIDYYASVSSSIDSDAYFDVMMRQAWKI